MIYLSTNNLFLWPPLHQLDSTFLCLLDKFYICNSSYTLLWTKCDQVFEFYYPPSWCSKKEKLEPEIIELTKLNGQQVREVVSYRNNTMAITSDNRLFAWGKNKHGELGVGDTEDRPHPVLVMHHVQRVSIGKCSTWALDSDGRLWRWGYSAADEKFTTSYYILTPLCMETPCPVIYLTQKAFDMMALTSNGDIYICDASLDWGARVHISLSIGLVVSSFTSLFESILLLSTEGELYCYEYLSDEYIKIEIGEPIASILTVKNCISHLAILTSRSGVHYLFHHEINARNSATWCQVITSEYTSLADLYVLHSSQCVSPGITVLARSSLTDVDNLLTMDYTFKRGERMIFAKRSVFCGDPTRSDIDHPFATFYTYLRYRHTNKLEAENELSFDLFALGHHYRLNAFLKALVDQISYNICYLHLNNPTQLIFYLEQRFGFISIVGYWYPEMLSRRFIKNRGIFLDQSLCATIVRFIVERGLKLVNKAPQKDNMIQSANFVNIFNSSPKSAN